MDYEKDVSSVSIYEQSWVSLAEIAAFVLGEQAELLWL